MELIDYALIIQIFALLNPLASFPFLLSAYQKRVDVKKIAVKSVLVAFIIGVVILYIGEYLFELFGVDLDSFRIAGGIVLLLLGINMVKPRLEEHKVHEKVNHLITIIATPLLTGPATISFITIKAIEIGKTPVLTNLTLAFVLVGMVFVLFSYMIKKINVTVVDIFSRIMGLFLTAISIEMIAKGIEGIIKAMI